MGLLVSHWLEKTRTIINILILALVISNNIFVEQLSAWDYNTPRECNATDLVGYLQPWKFGVSPPLHRSRGFQSAGRKIVPAS